MEPNYLSLAFEDAKGGDKRLLDQLQFLFEIEKLKAELRQTFTYTDKEQKISRQENSAEHSWHVTVFALLLKEYAAEPVDIAKTVEMMLLHELVEIYAGDTDVYSNHSTSSVNEREAAAAERIFGLLPPDQGEKYKKLWEEFEGSQTPESQYARAIDRVHPILVNFLSGGKGWQQRGITYDKVVSTHQERVSTGTPALWNAIKKALDYGHDHNFFAAPQQK